MRETDNQGSEEGLIFGGDVSDFLAVRRLWGIEEVRGKRRGGKFMDSASRSSVIVVGANVSSKHASPLSIRHAFLLFWIWSFFKFLFLVWEGI
jgi:hypothetical protein